jgi:prepilin-type N-terminal cleavage/methylation domain-containing protein/prepilin-type processing-associated H-X9-DG protein
MYTRAGTRQHRAFTLIELLTVVAIISLLISILMPSLGRARDQAKGVHCLARLKDMGNALGAYENENDDLMPPCEWLPDPEVREEIEYGWTELMYGYIWKEMDRMYDPEQAVQYSYPVQRNIPRDRWQRYFDCKASPFRFDHSGHYRVYLPAWLMGTYALDENRRYDIQNTILNPRLPASRSRIAPRMILLGDANAQSERIDTSYIDAGEANTAGSAGFNGNRFSDRHYGGTNYLFQDFSADWMRNKFREELGSDIDLNGVQDVEVIR